MARALLLSATLALATTFAASCSSDPAPAPGPSGSFGGTSGSSSGTAQGVECTHPGAGPSLGNGVCECSTTRNIAGDWSASRTCREGNTCPLGAGDESLTFTQSGTDVVGQSATTRITGKLCGDYVVWTGGPTSGAYQECGQIRLTDDTHYVKDSCYVASGNCTTSFGQGCPSEKGQCTGIAAKKPATAPAIVKNICL